MPGSFHRIVEQIHRCAFSNKSGDVVIHQFLIAAKVRGDRETTTEHRFGDHQRSSFVSGRKQQCLIGFPDLFHVLHISAEFELVLQAMHFDQRFKLAFVALVVSVESDLDRTVFPFVLLHYVDDDVLPFRLKVDSTDTGDAELWLAVLFRP